MATLSEKAGGNRYRRNPLELRCAVCGSSYLLETNALRKICEVCKTKYGHNWQDQVPELKARRAAATRRSYERKKQRQPDYWRRRAYGLESGEYARLLEAQDGRCAICLNFAGQRALAVDHDHETGEVRGLLCSNCNTAIGKLQDSPRLLEKAASYLRRHGKE